MTSRPTDNLDAWLPIATAPADGKEILVWHPDFSSVPHIRQADGDWWRSSGMGPTHWMPLPEPPERESDGSSPLNPLSGKGVGIP